MPRRFSSLLLSVVALLSTAGFVRAVPESLLRNSPFLPAGNAAPVAAQGGRLELRGIFAFEGTTRFAVFDTASNRSVWLAVGESEAGLRVVAYDPSGEAVTVEYEGQSQRLTMKEAQIVNVAVSLAAPSGVVPPGGSPAAVTPSAPANEQEIQERRARIIEELRRRRALRQAGQQGPGGPPLPQPMPQPPPQQ